MLKRTAATKAQGGARASLAASANFASGDCSSLGASGSCLGPRGGLSEKR